MRSVWSHQEWGVAEDDRQRLFPPLWSAFVIIIIIIMSWWWWCNQSTYLILTCDDEDQRQFWPTPPKPDIWFDKIFTATYSSRLSRSGSDQPPIQRSVSSSSSPSSEAFWSKILTDCWSHFWWQRKGKWYVYGGLEIFFQANKKYANMYKYVPDTERGDVISYMGNGICICVWSTHGMYLYLYIFYIDLNLYICVFFKRYLYLHFAIFLKKIFVFVFSYFGFAWI